MFAYSAVTLKGQSSCHHDAGGLMGSCGQIEEQKAGEEDTRDHLHLFNGATVSAPGMTVSDGGLDDSMK